MATKPTHDTNRSAAAATAVTSPVTVSPVTASPVTVSPVTASAVTIATLDGGVTSLTPESLAALRAQLEGPLLLAGDTGWDEAVRIWNGMVARTPSVVIQPRSAHDVAAAVRLARDRRLLLGIKGGGHHIAGTAIAERGLQLDMSRMCDVTVDPRAKLAVVGPGCRLRDVDTATQAHGLATPLGFISAVGVTGLTLGGGLGYLTRRFGWTVDNLESVEIVTADAEILNADRVTHSDLFWALRGGGGNFGVVTRLTLRLHDVGPTVHGGLIAWPFARAEEICDAYRAITAEAPPELAVWFVLLHAPPAPFVPAAWHHQRMCAMCVCYSGDLAKAEHVLAPIRALREPVFDLLQPQPYTQIQSHLDATEPDGAHYYWRTQYLSELTRPFLSTLRDLFAESPSAGIDIGILHLGGALNAHAADEGCVGNRDARFIVGVKGMWDAAEPEPDALQRWIRDAWKRVLPYSTGATYINFQSADEDEARVRASYGANWARLAAIKRRYDPQNLFRMNRNIRVD
jgi:FAD/FMN-containing dehydrogenase